MPLRLIPPGKRKGNRHYLVRGEIAGRRLEVSAKTADEKAALQFKARLELAILEDRVPGLGEEITFAQAVDLYMTFKQIIETDVDGKRFEKINRVLGAKLVTDIRHADLVKAAETLCAGRAPATKNREVMRPAAAVLHLASSNGHCSYLRVPLFKEPRPRTRSVTIATAQIILNSLPAEAPTKMGNRPAAAVDLKHRELRLAQKRLLLLWLFRQGNRISDALGVRWEGIDLKRQTVRYHVGKTDRPDVEKPLHDEVWELLAAAPKEEGWLFPWRTRSGVYKWLRPYCRSLGIHFTPHMARHSLGKWLNEESASLRTIMDTLDHADAKSSIRYQSTDVEAIRAAGGRIAKLVEK